MDRTLVLYHTDHLGHLSTSESDDVTRWWSFVTVSYAVKFKISFKFPPFKVPNEQSN